VATSADAGSFKAQLAASKNVWELALFLAEWAGAGHRIDDEWSSINREARTRWDGAERDRVDESHRQFIVAASSSGADRAAVSAIAWAVDHRCWTFFQRHWRQSYVANEMERIELGHGDPFPVTDLVLDRYQGVLEREELTTRGTAKHQTTPAELPHLRRFNSGIYKAQVFVEFGFDFELQAVLDPVSRIVLVQLNETMAELDIPGQVDCYPIRVHDEEEQLTRILAVLDQLDGDMPVLVVLPELSVTQSIVDGIHAHLENGRLEDVLVVAGSRHADEGGKRRNLSEGLMPGVRDRLVHRKLVPFSSLSSDAEHTVEGIDAATELTIYTAGVARFAFLICKDFLEPDLAGLVEHLGVNVLAVPSMSAVTKPDFNVPVGSFVQASQGFAAVVNGPYVWPDKVEPVEPSAHIGQPVRAAHVLEWEWPGSTWGGPAGITYEPGAGLSRP
jgi:hypothetical protein